MVGFSSSMSMIVAFVHLPSTTSETRNSSCLLTAVEIDAKEDSPGESSFDAWFFCFPSGSVIPKTISFGRRFVIFSFGWIRMIVVIVDMSLNILIITGQSVSGPGII